MKLACRWCRIKHLAQLGSALSDESIAFGTLFVRPMALARLATWTPDRRLKAARYNLPSRRPTATCRESVAQFAFAGLANLPIERSGE